jgi:hypothetical protein
MQADLLSDISMRYFVSQQDIANMIVYLASPLGATISGQALSVDAMSRSCADRRHPSEEAPSPQLPPPAGESAGDR